MKNLRISLALSLSALGATFTLQAQTVAPPDPGAELRRQDERNQALRQREEQAVDVKSPALPLDASRLPTSESPCFRIDRLQITSTQGSNFAWLADKLAGPHGDDAPLGKCLGTQGIALVLKRAQDALLQRGLVTSRALAQEQDLSTGTLTITVIPGQVSAIRFKDATATGVHLGNAVPSQTGALLNLRDVEQGLENLKRVPTAEADIQIEPAQDNAAPGQSDLVISYQQTSPARFSLSLDDSGSKGTGVYQGSATLSLDNPLGLSDLFYVTLNHDLGGGESGDRGTQGHIVHYSLAQLTGQRFLGGYTSEQQEYQALMDSGLTFAKAYNLRPGIALSAAQVASLTTDIVWLQQENITLPDGSITQALVPHLYAAPKDGDLAPSGALLSGNSVAITAASDVNTSGTILGRKLVQIDAASINNTVGSIGGQSVVLKAVQDINNVGGTVVADNNLILQAGRDINIRGCIAVHCGSSLYRRYGFRTDRHNRCHGYCHECRILFTGSPSVCGHGEQRWGYRQDVGATGQ